MMARTYPYVAQNLVLMVIGLTAWVGCQPAPPINERKASVPSVVQPDLSAVGLQESPLRPRPRVRSSPQVLPRISIAADGFWNDSDGVFVRVPVPDDDVETPVGPATIATLRMIRPSIGLAIPAGVGRLEGRPWLYIRLPAGSEVPSSIHLKWYQPFTEARAKGQVVDIYVNEIQQARHRRILPPRFFRAARRFVKHYGRLNQRYQSPFAAFAEGRLEALATRLEPSLGRTISKPSFAQVELMGLGHSSAVDQQKTLVRLGLGVGDPVQKEPESIELTGRQQALVVRSKVASDVGPTVPNWLHQASQNVPVDALVSIHKQPLSCLEWLGRVTRVEKWLTSVLDPTTAHGTPFLSVVGAFSKWLQAAQTHHPQIEWISLFSLDPWMPSPRDTDLTFVIEWKEGQGARQFLSRLGVGVPPSIGVRSDVMPIQVATKTLAHPSLSRRGIYWALNQRRLFVSTHRHAIEAARRCYQNPQACLGQDDEFRARLGAALNDTATDDWLVYGGHAFLDRQISASHRIRFRRSYLDAVERQARTLSSMFYEWLEGRALTSEMSANLRGLNIPQVSVGPRYRSELTKVRPTEWASYIRFLDRWAPLKRLVHPALMISTRSRKGFEIRIERLNSDTTIRSVERQLAPVGDQLISDAAVRLAIGFKADGQLFRLIREKLVQWSGRRDITLDWLGAWLQVGWVDTPGLVDFIRTFAPSEGVSRSASQASVAQRQRVLDRLPLYAILPVKREMLLTKSLVAVGIALKDKLRDAVEMQTLGNYRGYTITEVRERLADAGNQIGLFFARADGYLILALDRGVLFKIIDGMNGNAQSKNRDNLATNNNLARLVVDLSPNSHWTRMLMFEVDEYVSASTRRARRRDAYWTMLRSEANQREPMGWHRLFGLDEPTYGSEVAPKTPALPASTGLLPAMLNGGHRYELGVSRINTGRSTGLRFSVHTN